MIPHYHLPGQSKESYEKSSSMFIFHLHLLFEILIRWMLALSDLSSVMTSCSYCSRTSWLNFSWISLGKTGFNFYLPIILYRIFYFYKLFPYLELFFFFFLINMPLILENFHFLSWSLMNFLGSALPTLGLLSSKWWFSPQLLIPG